MEHTIYFDGYGEAIEITREQYVRGNYRYVGNEESGESGEHSLVEHEYSGDLFAVVL